MANFEAKQRKIAERYGRVLFDLAHENKNLKPVLKDVERLRYCLQEEPSAWSQAISPTLSFQTQRRIIERLATSLKLGSLMSRFLLVLCQNHRLQNLSSILEDFLAQGQAAAGIREGVVETAFALSQKEMKALQTSLKHRFGKEVRLRQEIKESLVGGVVLRMGSLMIDASLETQLNKLRQAMKG